MPLTLAQAKVGLADKIDQTVSMNSAGILLF